MELLLCKVEGKVGSLDLKKKTKRVPVVEEVAWRSSLFAGQNRKLMPENRIKEEKETVMLLRCFYFLCEAPEEKLYRGVFPSRGVTPIFQSNTLRAARRSSKA